MKEKKIDNLKRIFSLEVNGNMLHSEKLNSGTTTLDLLKKLRKISVKDKFK